MIKRAVKIILASLLLATNLASAAFAAESAATVAGFSVTTESLDTSNPEYATVHASVENAASQSRKLRVSAYFNDKDQRQIGYNNYVIEVNPGKTGVDFYMPAYAMQRGVPSDIVEAIVKPSIASDQDKVGSLYALEQNPDSESQNTSDSAYSNWEYYISNYDINVLVKENGDLDITEKISAYFNTAKHGIIRTIPRVNHFDSDGIIEHRTAKISNINVNNQFKIENTGDNTAIRIGNAAVTLTGAQEYEIRYTYNMGKNSSKDFDELYMNLIGPEWDAPIAHVNFSITMPKDFDANECYFYSGLKGSIQKSGVYYNIDGRVISGETTASMMPGEALTIRQKLPEDYFAFKEPYEEQPSLLLLYAIPIVAMTVCAVLWKLFGDDRIPEITSVTQLPAELSCPEVALIYRGHVKTDDVVATLFKLANEGYIQIVDNPEKSENFNIVRMRAYDGPNELEREFMKGLFEHSAKISPDVGLTITDLETNREINDGGDAIISSKHLKNYFYRTVDKITEMANHEYRDRYFEKLGSHLRIVTIIMTIVCAIDALVALVQCSAGGSFVYIALVAILAFYSIFFVPALQMKHGAEKAFVLIFLFVHMTVMCGGLFGLLPSQLMLIEPFFLGAIGVALISTVVCAIISVFMPRRNQIGSEYYALIKSHQEYLRNMTSTRISDIHATDMRAAYDILPYAFMFGLTAKWMRKFSLIVAEQAPSWYVVRGSGASFDADRFDKFVTSSVVRVVSNPNTGSSFSSSGSSSSSSSSGGGSSGGGGGGGGGSSW